MGKRWVGIDRGRLKEAEGGREEDVIRVYVRWLLLELLMSS